MALFNPNLFDRSDLLMFLEYFPLRSFFIMLVLGYCIYYLKREYADPYLVGLHPKVGKVVRNPLVSVIISCLITPVMIFMILVFDDYHDGF